MDLSFSTEVASELTKLKLQQPLLFAKIQKQLEIFKDNPKHPSLRTHKLKGNLSNAWSISIEGNTRMIYTLKDHEAIFFKLGNHDQVYRK